MLPEQQQRIMGYFIEEAKDHLNTIEQGLLSLQATIEDSEKANELFRAAHSVKGGAAMLGLESIQTTAHRMEDYFKILKESPVQVDSALETMFLRISDGLKDLLEQLEGPFGLTQDKAQEIMAVVDPVFGQLAQHLDKLVAASGGTQRGSAATDETLQTTFKRDVAALLRQLLGTFKQPDTADSRNSLQEICNQLHAVGAQFELSEWCDLIETARLASANLDNEYRLLAPVLIKEIKKSQDLVLSGRACEVAVAEAMQSLLPEDILATADTVDDLGEDSFEENTLGEEFENTTFDLEFSFSDEATESNVNLFGEEPVEENAPESDSDDLGDLFGIDSDIVELPELAELDLAQTPKPESEVSTAAQATQPGTDEAGKTHRVSLDLDFNEIPSELSALNRKAEAEEKVDESLDALLATVNVTGPDVGAEELTSLADLFDGDLEELDNTLGSHPFVSEEMRLHPEDIDLDEQDDLADFLLDKSFAESAENNQQGAEDELEDDLFGGTLTEGGFADSAALDLDADLEEALIEERAVEEKPIAKEANTETAIETDGLINDGPITSAAGTFTDDVGSVTEDLWDEGSEEPAELETTYSGLGFATISQEELESSLVTDDMFDLEDGIEEVEVEERTNPSWNEGSSVVSLFSEESVSPSEQEIEFPTLTGVQLKKAEQDIDSFFLDTDDDETAASHIDITPSESQTNSAAQIVEDDPWGELSLEGPPLAEEESFSDSVLSEIDLPIVDNDISDTELATAEDLFENPGSLTPPVSPEIEQSEDEHQILEEENTSGTTGVAEPLSRQADSFWEELPVEVEPESSETPVELDIFSGSFAEEATNLGDFDNLVEEGLGAEDIESESQIEAESEQAFVLDELELDSVPGLDKAATEGSSEKADELSDDLLTVDLLSQEKSNSSVDDTDFDIDLFDQVEKLPAVDDLFDQETEAEDFSFEAETFNESAADESLLLSNEALSSEALGNEAEIDSSESILDSVETGNSSLLLEDLPNSDNEKNINFIDNDDFLSFEENSTEENRFEESSSEEAQNDRGSDDDDGGIDLSEIEGLSENSTNIDLSTEAIDETISTLEPQAEKAEELLSLDLSLENTEVAEGLSEEESASEEVSLDEIDFGLETAVDDFDDLDSLLADNESESELSQPSASVEAREETSTVTDVERDVFSGSAEEDEDFDDLEKLLEEGDGESLPVSPRRAAAPRAVRRSSPTREQNMRVPVKHLDNLSNLVGELVVSRNTLERDQERLRQFLDNLLFQVQQLNDVGQRMRDLYERSLLESSLVSNRRAYALGNSQSSSQSNSATEDHATGATFDALEMDRFTGFHTLSQEMIELIVRVRESSSDIGYTVESSDQVTRQFRQITTQLQEGLNTARMVAFSQAADRLPRAVRDIALKCGKEAQLIVEGKDTLIDKMIVEHLYDPLTHLVNNAITHGVETPEARQAAGKPPEGSITVKAFYQGNQTVIYVADDGGGINPSFVQKKAVQKGLITQAEADALSDIETYDLLFHAGFSTRDTADDFAGRGVGMDVVRTSLAEIRGVITIDSEQGKGTSFTIRLPLTLSISKALSCVSNQARIAFPMDGVEDMLDVARDRIVKNEQGQDCVKWRDRILPFQAVTDLLKFNRTLGRGRVYGGSQDDDVLSIIVLRSANTVVALQVDQVIGEEEIVIKQLEGPVPKPLGIAGATILGDGRVMPIADVLELIDIAMGRVRREPSSLLWAETAEPDEEVTAKSDPTVLIVDDSITVRELLSMSFNKVGYRVEQARDGQEAWDKLRSGLPCDLVFCDIEMPRMDGLELLSRMQKDNHLKQVPIAMLTSRGADRHRQMAVDLGASGYFTKPYLEEALLDAAQRMLNGETLEKGRGG